MDPQTKTKENKPSFWKRVIITLSVLPGQLSFAILIAFVCTYTAYSFIPSYSFTHLSSLDNYLAFLGFIASIVAIVSSVSLAFHLYFIQFIQNEKLRLYDKFRETLYRLDDIVKKLPDKPIWKSSRDLTFHLKMKTLKELPLDDWDKLAKKVTQDADNHKNYSEFKKFTDVLDLMMYIEEVMHELRMMMFKEIISDVFLNTVLKSFATIGLLIITMISATIYFPDSFNIYYSFLAVLLGTFSVTLFIEFGWYVKRHTNEISKG